MSRYSAMSPMLATIRIRCCCSSPSANGAADQPMSIWPVIVCVNVAVGVPVPTALMSTPDCLMILRAARFDDEPAAENAIVLPAASFSDLIGEAAGTYQKISRAPVTEVATGRIGAPFE